MKTKPILFSTPMVQAIQEGRKTQTRRTIFKNEPSLNSPNIICTGFTDGNKIAHFKGKNSLTSTAGEKPKYQPGDIMWVRETCRIYGWCFEEGYVNIQYKDGSTEMFYPEIDDFDQWLLKKVEKLEDRDYLERDPENEERFVFVEGKELWEPSIFMPKWASRIFLEVTDVRVERLQDISEDDAISEGIKKGKGFEQFENYASEGYRYLNSAIDSFESLWQSINGKESWESNPWVWVYDFKKTEKPKNFI